MVEAIVFDLYGVLALNGWQAFKARHFSDRTDIWNRVFELGRRVDAGLADYSELITYTAKQSGQSEAAVRHELEHTVSHKELLSYIQSDLKPDYKIGVLSNAGSEAVLDIFTPDERELFDAVVLSSHIGATKPEARMYETVADKLDVNVSECIFVDDQERHANGAREAGMRAIVFQDVPQMETDLQAILADS